MRDGFALTGLGILTGTLAAIWLARGLTGLLHEVAPADPISIAGVASLLLAASLLAVYVPARRATRVDALDALRE